MANKSFSSNFIVLCGFVTTFEREKSFATKNFCRATAYYMQNIITKGLFWLNRDCQL